MTTSALSVDLVTSPEPPARRVRLPLVQQYLEEQRKIGAVERFSEMHDAGSAELEGRRVYEDLIPGRKPGAGEQYAFRVDLDRCTGCKACVTACRSLNGLDEGETWRSVGLLRGGSPREAYQQTVTTACHHCLEPACLKGCPVLAYEKDPVTGVVRHLDDQCIGCRYCTLTCPYEVPQYNEARGIVRKCDLCVDRLAAGEAPACVQACPNEAISITLVDTAAVRERAESDSFLPAAPSPGHTLPATEYVTDRVMPKNVLPADFYSVRSSEQHAPLAVMLVLTQLSAGAFAVGWLCSLAPGFEGARRYHALVALFAGVLALAASLFHLGRPLYAFRAVLGLRTSWLSREILAFGVFAGLAAAYAGYAWMEPLARFFGLGSLPLIGSFAPDLERVLAAAVLAAGTTGVLCSAWVYRATGRALWTGPNTVIRFGLTSLLLGAAVTLLVTTTVATHEAISAVGALALAILALSVIKLGYEASLLAHLRALSLTALKRSAILMTTELKSWTIARFIAGIVGGIVLPLLLLHRLGQTGADGALVALSLFLTLALLFAELAERTLFFSAVASRRMPGVGP